MIKKFILGTILVSTSGTTLTVAHYASHWYASFSDRMLAKTSSKVDEAIDKVAKLRGYERPKEDVSEWDALLIAERAALRRKINPSVVKAIVHHESGKKQFAISPVGAIGFMQIMPANAKRCGLSGPDQLLDKEKNIDCGVQIYAEELETYEGNVQKALWAYNGGPGAVRTILKCGHNIQCMGYKNPKDRGYAESYFYAQNVLDTVAQDITG